MTTNIAEGVSVVIPVHNEENTIEQTVESVLAQEGLSELEILIVFSGSNAATREAVARLAKKDPRIRSIESKLGKVPAVNDGRKAVKYDFVVFTDGDVVLSRDAIACAYETLHARDVMAVTAISTWLYDWKDPLTFLVNVNLTGKRKPDCLQGSFYVTRRRYLDKVFFEHGYDKIPEHVMADDLWLTQLFEDVVNGISNWRADPRIVVYEHPFNRNDYIKRVGWGLVAVRQVQEDFPQFRYTVNRDGWTGDKNLLGKIKIWYNKWIQLSASEKLWVPLVFPFKKLALIGVNEAAMRLADETHANNTPNSYWDPARSSKRRFPAERTELSSDLSYTH